MNPTKQTEAIQTMLLNVKNVIQESYFSHFLSKLVEDILLVLKLKYIHHWDIVTNIFACLFDGV